MRCLLRHRDGYVMGVLTPAGPNDPTSKGYYLTQARWWHRVQAALRLGFRPMEQLQREEQERDPLTGSETLRW